MKLVIIRNSRRNCPVAYVVVGLLSRMPVGFEMYPFEQLSLDWRKARGKLSKASYDS